MGGGASSQKKKGKEEAYVADAEAAAAELAAVKAELAAVKAAADAAAELAAVKAELAAVKAGVAANGNVDPPSETFTSSSSSDGAKPETTTTSGPAKSEAPSITASAKAPTSASAAAVPTSTPTSASSGESLGAIDPRVVQMLIDCHEELEMNASGDDSAAKSERKRNALLNFVRDESALETLSVASMREIVKFISAALFVAEEDESSKVGMISSSSRVVTHVQFDTEAIRGGGELAADKVFAFDLLNELRSNLEFKQSREAASKPASRKYILGMELLSRSFILKLVKAFHCDGAQERNKLKHTLHQSLFKLPQKPGPSAMNMQSPPADVLFIRHVINSELYRFIYETQLHSGISELLTVYETICRGFKAPLKEEHREFLFKVLMPLHSVYALPQYFEALEKCIMNYLRLVRPGELNAKLRETVDVFWPLKSPEGTVRLLRSEYLELILASEDESGAENGPSLANLLSRLGCCKKSDYKPEAAAAAELLQKLAAAGKNIDSSEHSMDHQEHSLARTGSSKLKLQMRSPTRTSAFGASTDIMASALEGCRQKDALYGVTSRNIFHATPWKESASMRPLSEAMQDVKLISAGWLVQLAKANVRPPRCQDIPPEAEVTLESLENSPGVPILVISYPWLARAHPDELGEQLQLLAFIFKAFYTHAKKLISPLVTVGVFWDYLSLPQPSLEASLATPFVDDRTPEEKATFKKGLRGINTWYAHPRTTVILMTNSLPTGMDYLNKQPYEGRGWCVAERRMSSIVKHTQCLINAGVLDGSEGQNGDLLSLISKGAEQESADRDAPTAPHKFRKELVEGIEKGTIKFTHPSDVDLVCRIYTDAFLDSLGVCEDLDYSFLGWGDQQIRELVESFQYYLQKRGPLTKLRRIELHHNNITDDGLEYLALVVHEDAMPNLTWLGLSHNNTAQISERGRKAVQDAVSEITKLLADSTSEEESNTLLHVKLNLCRSGNSIGKTMTEIMDHLRSPDVVVTAKQVDHIVRFTHWWVELDGLHTDKNLLLFDVLRDFLMTRQDRAVLESAFDEMWIRSVLIEAFDTPKALRRNQLKKFTYNLYSHCKTLRDAINDAMLRALQAHVEKDRGGSGSDATGEGGAGAIVEDDNQDDSGDCYFVEILEILEAISKGYKPSNLELWEKHCSEILERTLLPLHGSSHLADFHEPLFRCTREFLKKDPTRVAPMAFDALSEVLRARGKGGDCSGMLLEEARNIATVAGDHAGDEGLLSRVDGIFG